MHYANKNDLNRASLKFKNVWSKKAPKNKSLHTMAIKNKHIKNIACAK